jgi:hypothetical protein
MAGTVIPAHVSPLTVPGPIIDRRGFLVGAGAVLVGLVAVRGTDAASALFGQTSARASDALSLTMFAPLIGSTFRVRSGVFGTVPLTLIAADATQVRAGHPKPTSGEAFTLVLSGSVTSRLDDGQHQLLHPDLDVPSVFLSRIGRGLRTQDYQVVIDRRIFKHNSKKAG